MYGTKGRLQTFPKSLYGISIYVYNWLIYFLCVQIIG